MYYVDCWGDLRGQETNGQYFNFQASWIHYLRFHLIKIFNLTLIDFVFNWFSFLYQVNWDTPYIPESWTQIWTAELTLSNKLVSSRFTWRPGAREGGGKVKLLNRLHNISKMQKLKVRTALSFIKVCNRSVFTRCTRFSVFHADGVVLTGKAPFLIVSIVSTSWTH
jgi:hypothetical protein